MKHMPITFKSDMLDSEVNCNSLLCILDFERSISLLMQLDPF